MSHSREAGRSVARFAAAYAGLHGSHVVADHIVQSDRDACDKALPGVKGHLACARHVASYTATQLLALLAINNVTGAGLKPGRVAAGLALSAVSHYAVDRRTMLQKVVDATGKARFYRLGAPRPGKDDNPTLGTGAYALDQAAHTGLLFLAALIIAGGES
jgi:hypothetical protein